MADSSNLFERIKRFGEDIGVVARPQPAPPQPTAVERYIQEIHRRRALVETLDAFIQNIYHADGLCREDAQRNVAESLVELTYFGQHSSNGLLITNDGYFLTAWHCVQNDGRYPLNQARVRLYDGTMYPVERICASSKSEELAIVKAAIPNTCTPRQYRFYNTNLLDNDAVVLLSRWNGNLVVKDGSITHANYKVVVTLQDHDCRVQGEYYNHFLTNHAAIPGDSGGTITTPDGRVAGLVSGGRALRSFNVKMIRMLDLIDKYKRHIQNSLD